MPPARRVAKIPLWVSTTVVEIWQTVLLHRLLAWPRWTPWIELVLALSSGTSRPYGHTDLLYSSTRSTDSELPFCLTMYWDGFLSSFSCVSTSYSRPVSVAFPPITTAEPQTTTNLLSASASSTQAIAQTSPAAASSTSSTSSFPDPTTSPIFSTSTSSTSPTSPPATDTFGKHATSNGPISSTPVTSVAAHSQAANTISISPSSLWPFKGIFGVLLTGLLFNIIALVIILLYLYRRKNPKKEAEPNNPTNPAGADPTQSQSTATYQSTMGDNGQEHSGSEPTNAPPTLDGIQPIRPFQPVDKETNTRDSSTSVSGTHPAYAGQQRVGSTIRVVESRGPSRSSSISSTVTLSHVGPLPSTHPDGQFEHRPQQSDLSNNHSDDSRPPGVVPSIS